MKCENAMKKAMNLLCIVFYVRFCKSLHLHGQPCDSNLYILTCTKFSTWLMYACITFETYKHDHATWAMEELFIERSGSWNSRIPLFQISASSNTYITFFQAYLWNVSLRLVALFYRLRFTLFFTSVLSNRCKEY